MSTVWVLHFYYLTQYGNCPFDYIIPTYTGRKVFFLLPFMGLKTPFIGRNIYIFSIDQLKEVNGCTCINIILICSKDTCSWRLIGDFIFYFFLTNISACSCNRVFIYIITTPAQIHIGIKCISKSMILIGPAISKFPYTFYTNRNLLSTCINSFKNFPMDMWQKMDCHIKHNIIQKLTVTFKTT